MQTNMIQLECTDSRTASKRLKSETVSSEASATSSAIQQFSPTELKTEPSVEEIKPDLVRSAPRDASIPQVSANISMDDFQLQLLSAASEETIPKVIVNTAIPAFDPLWPRNKPHHPGFHPNIPKIEDQIRTIVGQVDEAHDKAKEEGFEDDIVKAYIGRLVRSLQGIMKSKEREIVALLGNMGIGKSEAYESLVGRCGIAIKVSTKMVVSTPELTGLQSDSGRGTHFPIEGHGKTSAQTAEIEVTMVWKTRNEYRAPVTTSCHAVYAYLNGDKVQDAPLDEADESDEEADDGENVGGDTAADRQYQCDRALHHLLPLLHEQDHSQFGDYKTLAEWLHAQQGDHFDLDAVVTTLLNRIMVLRRMHGIGDSTNTFPANSTQEAIKILEDHSPPTLQESEELSRWDRSHHLKEARLHFHNDMGHEGIIFADVPGRNDPDLVMADMIEQYVDNADRYIIMAPAGRPITKEIDEYIRQAIRSKKPNIFVVTKIDVKDDLTAKEMADLPEDIRRSFDLAAADVEAVNVKVAAAQAQKKAFEAVQDYRQAHEMTQQIQCLQDVDLFAAKGKLHQLKVEARNRKEKDEIHAQYKKLARTSHGAANLPVVFISAKEYSKHLKAEPTMLDYEATGVPKLFRLLYRCNASKRMEKLQRLCYSELPRHLSAIKHVLNKTPLQRYQEFRSTLADTLVDFVNNIVQAADEEVTSWITQYLLEPFTHSANKVWPKATPALLHSWATTVRPATFHASCKKNGKHRDRKWNQEIQDLMAGDKNQSGATSYFIRLLLAIQDASDKMGDSLISRISQTGPEDMTDYIFRSIETKLNDLHFREIPTSKDFLRELKHFKLDFRAQMEDLFKIFGDEVVCIKDDTIVGATGRGIDNTYVGRSMRKTYELAAAVKKEDMVVPPPQFVPGARGRPKKVKQPTQAQLAHARRVELIKKKFGLAKKSVFNEVKALVEEKIEKAKAAFLQDLQNVCSDLGDGVLQAFDGFYVNEGVEKLSNERFSPELLEGVVDRVLAQLPADPVVVAEAVKNGIPAPEKGTIEKLLDECNSWKAIYPSEQDN